jgi:hypothetical protein
MPQKSSYKKNYKKRAGSGSGYSRPSVRNPGRDRRKGNIFYRRGAKKLISLVKYLNIETKYFDVDSSDNVTDALSIVPCTNIAQGDTAVTVMVIVLRLSDLSVNSPLP